MYDILQGTCACYKQPVSFTTILRVDFSFTFVSVIYDQWAKCGSLLSGAIKGIDHNDLNLNACLLTFAVLNSFSD